MDEFIAKYESQIGGVISGLDRLVFRGSLRALVHERGMKNYLWHQVLLKEFGKHAERTSKHLNAALVEQVDTGTPRSSANRTSTTAGMRDQEGAFVAPADPNLARLVHTHHNGFIRRSTITG